MEILWHYIFGQIITIHYSEMLGHFGMIPLIDHHSSEGEQ